MVSSYIHRFAVVICLIVLVTVLNLSGHTNADATESSIPEKIKTGITDEERQWIRGHPQVILGVDPGFAPFEFINEDGVYQGMASEYVAMIGAALGISLRVAPGLTWPEVIQKARKREIDVLPCVGKNKEREQFLLFSDAYLSFPRVVFTRINGPVIKSVEELATVSVGVQNNSSHHGWVKEHTRIQPVLYPTAQETLFALSSGEIDTAIGNIAANNYIIKKLNITNLKFAFPVPGEPRKLYFAVRKDWPQLVTLLNKVLKAIGPNEKQAIVRHWSGAATGRNTDTGERLSLPEPPEFNQINFLLRNIAAVFALLMVAIVIAWLVKGRPRQLSIRDTLLLVSFVFAGLIVAIGVHITVLLDGEQAQSDIEARKDESLNLALELKQASDDLTRFARTYAVTGDPKYAQYFQAVIAIRDGKRAHPKAYSRAFWDHVAAGNLSPDEKGAVYSIEDRMKELGITPREQEKLIRAKQLSDDLIRMEETAMNAVRGNFKDTKGNFTRSGEPDSKMARDILHGDAYHKAKSRIMKPIDDFYILLEFRIAHELNLIRQRNQALLISATVLVFITIGFAAYVFFLFRRRMISPLVLLETGARAISEGNLAYRIGITSRDEVGRLALAFNSMASSIDSHTAQLKEARVYLQNLLESVPDGLIVVDETGGVLVANDQIGTMLGYKRDQIIGRPVETLVPGHIKVKHKKLREAFFKKPANRSMGAREELYAQHADGSLLPVDISLNRIQTSQGLLVVTAIRDITERKKNEEQILKLSNVVEQSPVSVIVTGTDGTIEYVNPTFTAITGYEGGEVMGKTPDLLNPDNTPDGFYQEIYGQLLEGGSWSGDLLNRKKNGDVFWAKLYFSSVRDSNGTITHFICLGEDVTDQKGLQQERDNALKQISESIQYAALIQSSLTPNNELFREYFSDYFAIWHPRDIVGGDIYLFEKLRSENECLLMVIDCTGHGVPGAFVTMLVKAVERQIITEIHNRIEGEVSPAWILGYFNRTMKKLLRQEDQTSVSDDGFDGAVLYYNKKDRYVTFAGANTPLFCMQAGALSIIKGDRHSVGYVRSDAGYRFKEHRLEVTEGMALYLTTDGYLDQKGGPKGFGFGKKRFSAIIRDYAAETMADQQEMFLYELAEYQGKEEQRDDITIVGVRI